MMMDCIHSLTDRKIALISVVVKVTDRRNGEYFICRITDVIKKSETVPDVIGRLAKKAENLGYDVAPVFGDEYDAGARFQEVTIFPENLWKKE